jgi:hypothetical protein
VKRLFLLHIDLNLIGLQPETLTTLVVKDASRLKAKRFYFS